MSDVLDLAVHGDPAACRSAAAGCAGVRRSVSTADGHVGRARSIGASWRGRAGAAFETKVDETARDLRELDDRIDAVEKALSDFAGELAVVEARMSEARRVATAGGVAISGDQLARPQAPADGAEATAVSSYDAQARAWNEAVGIADDARRKEEEAHQHLADGIGRSTGDGWLADLLQRLGLLPPDFADGDDVGAWLFGLGGLGFGAGVGWMVDGRFGTFQPRINGRFGSASGMGFWQRAAAATGSDSFHALPLPGREPQRLGHGREVGRPRRHGGHRRQRRLEPVAGRRRRPVDGRRRARHPGRDHGRHHRRRRVGRRAGRRLGRRRDRHRDLPGVGTVVGGVVGGLVGGAIGGFAGSELGEAVLDPVGDAAEATADFVGDVGEGIGDTASDVGDAITFWD